VLFDVRELEIRDPRAIAVFELIHRKLLAAGGRLTVIGASGSVLTHLQQYGLSQRLLLIAVEGA
jgi:hypothetical protein